MLGLNWLKTEKCCNGWLRGVLAGVQAGGRDSGVLAGVQGVQASAGVQAGGGCAAQSMNTPAARRALSHSSSSLQ